MNHVAPPASGIDDTGLRALSRGFAANAAQIDREASFPAANICRLRDAGLLALTVPKRYGSAGGGLLDTVRVLGIVAEGCASTGLILAMQLFKLAALNRGNLWPEAVRASISAEAVSDGALINALRVEPALGSPSRGGRPSTVLRRTTGGWALSGHKIFSTGAPGLRWMDVWAAHGDEVGRHGRERIECGRLRPGADGGVVAAAVDVIDPDHVGQKHCIEQPTFGGLRQVGPVFRCIMPHGCVVRIRPESCPGVARGVHVKRVQANFLRHDTRPRNRDAAGRNARVLWRPDGCCGTALAFAFRTRPIRPGSRRE
jgi:hypothetical protein